MRHTLFHVVWFRSKTDRLTDNQEDLLPFVESKKTKSTLEQSESNIPKLRPWLEGKGIIVFVCILHFDIDFGVNYIDILMSQCNPNLIIAIYVADEPGKVEGIPPRELGIWADIS